MLTYKNATRIHGLDEDDFAFDITLEEVVEVYNHGIKIAYIVDCDDAGFYAFYHTEGEDYMASGHSLVHCKMAVRRELAQQSAYLTCSIALN
jgi:hypothetical protein